MAGELSFGEMTKTDIVQWIDWSNDPEIAPLMRPSDPQGKSREFLATWYERLIDDEKTRILTIHLDGRFIGIIYLTKIDARNGNALISVLIGEKDTWGKGHGTQAINKIVDIAFGEYHL